MLHKCARSILAAVVALSLCFPVAAFADDGQNSAGSGNPIQDLFYMVVGYGAADDTEGEDEGDAFNPQTASAAVYPTTLTAPPANKEHPELAGASDLLNDGILLGSGGNLYYLRQAAFPKEDGGFISAYKTLERYNIANGTWTTLASLPMYMEFCSAAVFGANELTEGQIVLIGTEMDVVDDIPAHAASPVAHVYTFNPNDEYPEWVEVQSSQTVPVGASLVNNGGLLEMVGGILNGSPSATVYTYEMYNGSMDAYGTLSTPVAGADVVPHNGSLIITSYGSTLTDLQEGTGSAACQVYDETNGSSAPSFPTFATPANIDDYPSQRSVMAGSLGWADAGAVYVGPISGDNVTDTYLLNWGTPTWATFDQTADSQTMSGTAATVYIGGLYALGSVLNADGSANLVFRRTDMPDASIESGDNSIWRKDSGVELPFVFTPDYGRFKHIVKVDGSEILVGVQYDSSTGSTVVNLHADFLQELELGDHTITALFDDGFTQVTAPFKIEGPASQIDEGYTRPGELARTFDPLPVVPIAVLAVVAALLAIGAFRRGSSNI